MDTRRRTLLALAAASSVGFSAPAWAQAYPNRPISVVVPFAAGGATDLLARVFSKAMEKYAGQPFVIENVGGAGATLGTAKAAAAAPDGYTVLLAPSGALVMAPHLYSGLKYDPLSSFEPIAKVASAPYVLATRAGSKFQRYEDLVDFAKKNPEKLNFGSGGEGSAPHLTTLLILDGAKVSATHIPFRGAAPAWAALLAGDIDFIVDTPSGALPMVSGGKATALAVTSAARNADLPAVRTLQEVGQPGVESQAWFALLVPKGTPAAIVATLRKAADQVLRDPEVVAALKASHFVAASPEEAARVSADIRREHERWGGIIRARGIQLK